MATMANVSGVSQLMETAGVPLPAQTSAQPSSAQSSSVQTAPARSFATAMQQANTDAGVPAPPVEAKSPSRLSPQSTKAAPSSEAPTIENPIPASQAVSQAISQTAAQPPNASLPYSAANMLIALLGQPSLSASEAATAAATPSPTHENAAASAAQANPWPTEIPAGGPSTEVAKPDKAPATLLALPASSPPKTTSAHPASLLSEKDGTAHTHSLLATDHASATPPAASISIPVIAPPAVSIQELAPSLASLVTSTSAAGLSPEPPAALAQSSALLSSTAAPVLASSKAPLRGATSSVSSAATSRASANALQSVTPLQTAAGQEIGPASRAAVSASLQRNQAAGAIPPLGPQAGIPSAETLSQPMDTVVAALLPQTTAVPANLAAAQAPSAQAPLKASASRAILSSNAPVAAHTAITLPSVASSSIASVVAPPSTAALPALSSTAQHASASVSKDASHLAPTTPPTSPQATAPFPDLFPTIILAAPATHTPVALTTLSNPTGPLLSTTLTATGSASTTEAVAHTTLTSTPTTLEVGVASGTHGWLKIRAELNASGTVDASLTGTNAAATGRLHNDLPALSSFLQDEKIALGSLNVAAPSASASALHAVAATTLEPASSFTRSAAEGVGATGTAVASDAGASGSNGRAPQQQAPESSPALAVPREDGGAARTLPTQALYGVSAELAATGTLSPDSYGGGSWLNVRV